MPIWILSLPKTSPSNNFPFYAIKQFANERQKMFV
jgi:hypothetical protein